MPNPEEVIITAEPTQTAHLVPAAELTDGDEVRIKYAPPLDERPWPLDKSGQPICSENTE